MFTDRRPGMEIPGLGRVITPRPWDQLGGGHEIGGGSQLGGGEEIEGGEKHGGGEEHGRGLEEGVVNQGQGQETINTFSDRGHWMEILGG